MEVNIYEKIQNVRVDLQGKNLKKSGKNAYAGYSYYELGDILPAINELFKEYSLCSQISFDSEIASLKVINTEKPEEVIVFTSPMRDANLKGCHDIQNLGAVETYQRRYLYMAAMEIVESDALDKTTGQKAPVKEEPKKQNQQPQKEPPQQETPAKTTSEPQQRKVFGLMKQKGLSDQEMLDVIFGLFSEKPWSEHMEAYGAEGKDFTTGSALKYLLVPEASKLIEDLGKYTDVEGK